MAVPRLPIVIGLVVAADFSLPAAGRLALGVWRGINATRAAKTLRWINYFWYNPGMDWDIPTRTALGLLILRNLRGVGIVGGLAPGIDAEARRRAIGPVVQRLAEALNQRAKPFHGSKIGMLGVAYKKDVDAARESPTLVLIELLQKAGAVASYNDPHVPRLQRTRHFCIPTESSPLTAEYLASQDCILIAADHSAYDYDFIVRHAVQVLDTQNAPKNVHAGREKICKA